MIKVKFKTKYGLNKFDVPIGNGKTQSVEFNAKYGINNIEIPIDNKVVTTSFYLKYGETEVTIPITVWDKVYFDNAKGLSDLFAETFTIFMQIPTSQTQATVRKWIKKKIHNCDRRDGIFDKSTGTMANKANSWTVMCKDWQTYKKPLWVDGGYYTLPDYEKEGECWTCNVGDLLVFADVDDVVPTSTTEFNTLRTKYKDNGGQITSAEAYINFKPNGTPHRVNHIQMVKG